MKTIFGIGLIILGFITLVQNPDLGNNGAETIGVLLGISIVTFMLGIFKEALTTFSNTDNETFSQWLADYYSLNFSLCLADHAHSGLRNCHLWVATKHSRSASLSLAPKTLFVFCSGICF